MSVSSSASYALQDAAEPAKASQDAAAALNKSGPPNTMSKAQESKAMPLAGQANDHSTPVRDGKPKVRPPLESARPLRQATARIANTALVPPKAKEFDNMVRPAAPTRAT